MWVGVLGSLAIQTDAAGCGCSCAGVAAPVSVVFIAWLESCARREGEVHAEGKQRLQEAALVRKCVSSLLKTRLHVGHFPRWFKLWTA